MLIIKFVFRGCQYTWFVHPNYALYLSFLLTVIAGVTFRTFKSKKKNTPLFSEGEKKTFRSPLGGALSIIDCIDPDDVYEVVDPSVELIVRRMIKALSKPKTEIVTPPVFIMAYSISRTLLNTYKLLGFTFCTDVALDVGLKIALGITTGSVFFMLPFGLMSLTSAIIGLAVATNLSFETLTLRCEDIIRKLPVERYQQDQRERPVVFLDSPADKAPKILMKDRDEIEIYSPVFDKDAPCVTEAPIDLLEALEEEENASKASKPKKQKPTVLKRTCRRKYVPLSQRTKTLADLKSENTYQNKELADASIEKYEDKRIERYKRRRQQIQNQRININNINKNNKNNNNDYDSDYD